MGHYVNRLPKEDWHYLLHHTGKTPKKEIVEAVVGDFQKLCYWMTVGLREVPDPEIRQAFRVTDLKNILSLILDDFARKKRAGQLKVEINQLRAELDETTRSNVRKVLKRKLTTREHELKTLNPNAIDKERLEIALDMVQKGTGYVLQEYEKLLEDMPLPFRNQAVQYIQELHDKRDSIRNVVLEIQKQIALRRKASEE